MEKKIIAIALVLVLMVTAFVGCSKKLETTLVDGKELVLVTDEEGNTIIDEDYRIAFYVTNPEGKLIENDNGEPETNWMKLKNPVSDGDSIQDSIYKLNIPEGWTVGRDNLLKDGTDGNCHIQFFKIADVTEEMNMSIYLEGIDKQDGQIVEALKKEGYKAEVKKGTGTIAPQRISGATYSILILDKNDEVIHYVDNFFFTHENVIYKLEYACINGVGYDKDFDFFEYLRQNFMLK